MLSGFCMIPSLILLLLSTVRSQGGPQVLPLITGPQITYKQGNQATIFAGTYTGRQLYYYGGNVLETVNIQPVFYGNTTSYIQELITFYSAVANSTYFDWLLEYNTNQTKSTGITRGYVTAGYWDKTVNVPVTITDQDIQKYIVELIASKKLIPTNYTYIPIHFAPGVSIVAGGQVNSCYDFCAYHSTVNITGLVDGIQYAAYGVIPDQGGQCSLGCGSDPVLLNNLQSISSHELFESVLDPFVGLGQVAWYGVNGEIGDLCNHIHGEVVGANNVTYVVQKQYSNEAGDCIVGKGSSTPQLIPTVVLPAPPPPTSTTYISSKSTTLTTTKATATTTSSKHKSNTKNHKTSTRKSISKTSTKKTNTHKNTTKHSTTHKFKTTHSAVPKNRSTSRHTATNT